MLTKVIITAASGKPAGATGWRCTPARAGAAGACSLRVIQRSLVAVVAIGDDQLLVGHGRGEQADGRRVADPPEPVQHTVLVGDFGFGGAAAVVENFFHAAGGVGVEHENLSKMRTSGLQQIEPVALGL